MGENCYIYQIVHTLSHSSLYLEEHCMALERCYMDIFFRPINIDTEDIKHRITALLVDNFAPYNTSVFVELRLRVDGVIEIEEHSRSLSSGYVLRSLSPRGRIVEFPAPFGFALTSARRSVLDFALSIAQNHGGDVAVECDAEKNICSIDGAAAFALINRRLITPPTVQSIERDMLLAQVRAQNIPIEERNIKLSEIQNFDEFFFVDHRGITALISCQGHPFMNIFATHLAAQFATPWK